MNCIHCNSDNVVKCGKFITSNGIVRQRYLCKNCNKKFVVNPIKPKYSEEFKDKIVKAVVKEGMGIRQSSRVFKVSVPTIIKWVKEYKLDEKSKIFRCSLATQAKN